MELSAFRLRPLGAFGTPIAGDTLFGQLCWALRNRHGERRLEEWLDGYTSGRPFVVISDAMPDGYLPRPVLPLRAFEVPAGADRKELKRLAWIPSEAVAAPVHDWLTAAHAVQGSVPATRSAMQPHNSIDRRTGTTGKPPFAPFARQTFAWPHGTVLAVWMVFDPERIEIALLTEALSDIGRTGYGRDASTGLGRWEVVAVGNAGALPVRADANAWLALAPIAPQGLPWRTERCAFEAATRFGRHGDIPAVAGPRSGDGAPARAQPFKRPVMLARAGAVLTPADTAAVTASRFAGQGIGGDGMLSTVVPGTVHQGYAPVVPVTVAASAWGAGHG